MNHLCRCVLRDERTVKSAAQVIERTFESHWRHGFDDRNVCCGLGGESELQSGNLEVKQDRGDLICIEQESIVPVGRLDLPVANVLTQLL